MLLAKKPKGDDPSLPNMEQAKDLDEIADFDDIYRSIPVYAVFAPDCLGYPADYRFKMIKPNSGIAVLCKPCTVLFKSLGLKDEDFYPCDCYKCKRS